MAGPRPGLADQVMIVQGSSIEAYQRAVSGFNQIFGASPSLPGIASIQPAQVVVIDPDDREAPEKILRRYQELQPRVIVAIGSQALEAVKDLNSAILYLLVANPEAIIQQRANITGIRMLTAPAPQLTTIKETFPAVKRIGLLHNPQSSADFLSQAYDAAGRLDLTIVSAPASSDREAFTLLEGMADSLDAVWLIPDNTLISPILLNGLALLTLKNGIPLIAFAPKYLDLGAAMAIYTSPEQSGVQAANLVKRLLQQPSAGERKAEFGAEATALTNVTILRKLGLTSKLPSSHGGQTP